jgi:redox-sensitive bicupin YhaK (pirin superfamily)
MDRKQFLKTSLLGTAGLATSASANAKPSTSTYDKLMDQVGFNHLPNEEIRTPKTVLHRAETRGHADHGWLNTHHTFSFANYRNPERMHFGVLRVLNDDVVAAGRGFGRHPHDNMEIVSIPLEGDLKHQDSMGNTAVIRQGEVQMMSAGTGIYHSEFNGNSDQEVKFLQIWMFPNKKNITPRYDQIELRGARNVLEQILSPTATDAGVTAQQDSWWHLGDLDKGFTTDYCFHRGGNGLYAFVIEGQVNLAGQDLNPRDGFGIWDVEQVSIKATVDARLLLMEVPMTLG